MFWSSSREVGFMTALIHQRHEPAVDKPPFGPGQSCLTGFVFGPIAAGIIADANSYRLGYPARAHFATRGLLIVIGLFLLALIPALEIVTALLYLPVCWLFAIWINDSQRAAYRKWQRAHPDRPRNPYANWPELIAIGVFWLLMTASVWLIARYLLAVII